MGIGAALLRPRAGCVIAAELSHCDTNTLNPPPVPPRGGKTISPHRPGDGCQVMVPPPQP